MPWLPHLHDHGHCYVQLPRLDSAGAGAHFFIGEVLAPCAQSARWLQCADKRLRRLPDVQRKIVCTIKPYKGNIMRVSWCTWLFWPNTHVIDDLGTILLATDNSQHTRVLQELRYMSTLQIRHQEGSWTIRSTTHTWLAMVVNPHQLHIRAAGGWRTYDGYVLGILTL